MGSKNENRALFVDKEAISALSQVQDGILLPVTGLMDSKTAAEVDATKEYKGKTFPFSFVLAPSGNKNKEILSSAKRGETLDIVCNNKKYGELKVEEVFKIDPFERVKLIYGTSDTSHPGVARTLKRLGDLAISGEYKIDFDDIKDAKARIEAAKNEVDAKHISALMIAAKPLHRAHERMIRLALDRSELLVIFLLKPYTKDLISYELRERCLRHMVDNYLPKNRVVIVPFENNYLFAGNNEMILDAIAAQNFGCDRLITGQNHVGLGMFYDQNTVHSVFDTLKGINIEIEIMSEFVYCNVCRTLVSVGTCPHGQHHHISYHSGSILEILKAGLLPPAVLVRKEVSAIILSSLFPNRFKNLEKLYYDIVPISGLLEQHNEEEFYMKLMDLYQTTSLT